MTNNGRIITINGTSLCACLKLYANSSREKLAQHIFVDCIVYLLAKL